MAEAMAMEGFDGGIGESLIRDTGDGGRVILFRLLCIFALILDAIYVPVYSRHQRSSSSACDRENVLSRDVRVESCVYRIMGGIMHGRYFSVCIQLRSTYIYTSYIHNMYTMLPLYTASVVFGRAVDFGIKARTTTTAAVTALVTE